MDQNICATMYRAGRKEWPHIELSICGRELANLLIILDHNPGAFLRSDRRVRKISLPPVENHHRLRLANGSLGGAVDGERLNAMARQIGDEVLLVDLGYDAPT